MLIYLQLIKPLLDVMLYSSKSSAWLIRSVIVPHGSWACCRYEQGGEVLDHSQEALSGRRLSSRLHSSLETYVHYTKHISCVHPRHHRLSAEQVHRTSVNAMAEVRTGQAMTWPHTSPAPGAPKLAPPLVKERGESRLVKSGKCWQGIAGNLLTASLLQVWASTQTGNPGWTVRAASAQAPPSGDA